MDPSSYCPRALEKTLSLQVAAPCMAAVLNNSLPIRDSRLLTVFISAAYKKVGLA